MKNDKLRILKTLIDNWETLGRLTAVAKGKLRKIFGSPEKPIGFIRRDSVFRNLMTIFQSSSIKKYATYIVPTEYRAYLIRSVRINKLYQSGKKEQADRERSKLDQRARRLYNLYATRIIAIVFDKIDELQKLGLPEATITGHASKMIDDLMNDKCIIYVTPFHGKKKLYSVARKMVLGNGYCLIHSSGNCVPTAQYIYTELGKDSKTKTMDIKIQKYEIGGIRHFNLAIFIKGFMPEDDNHKT